MQRLPQKPSPLANFGEVKEPSESAEPILSRTVRDALGAWIEEIWAEVELKAVGLTARRRALFNGPPGVGKTTLAHHLAMRLGLPMLIVHAEKLQGSFIAESARNIGALFDALNSVEDKVVVMFDEFDSLAAKRMASGGAGSQAAANDHNLTVNTLLSRLDGFKGFAIAATNNGKDIDHAVWRRFEIHMQLELPEPGERRRIIDRYLRPYRLPRRHLESLASGFDTATPALMRQFCEGLKRNLIVGPKVGWSMIRDDVVDRVLSTVLPHEDLGKPSLWAQGSKHHSIKALPWPLTTEAPNEDAKADEPTDNVVSMTGARAPHWTGPPPHGAA